jgi:copper transport protein
VFQRPISILFTLALLCAALVVRVPAASAHANLIRSEPAANATLDRAPEQVTLYFTEPLEAQFSGITLRDQDGNLVPTAPSVIDPADPFVMSLAPGDLPEGLYTVAWRSLSSADGHQASGSFAFVIGTAQLAALASGAAETVPPIGAALRALDLLTLSLAIGALGFTRFVSRLPDLDSRLRRLVWFGWLALGVVSLLLIPYQLGLVTGEPFPQSFNALVPLLTNTRFGLLWLARMAFWLLFGLAFRRRAVWLALLFGAALLMTRSLNSHSSAMHDPLVMVLADWLHLAATVLWIGGLVQFASVAIPMRRDLSGLAALVGRFSNYARILVAAITVAGLYLGWMHVGSIEAMLTTLYGQALLIKLILFAPLLGIAAVNLLVTHRRLRQGSPLWSGRLRGLLGAEIALVVGILVAVGVLTSANPARSVFAARQPPPDNTSTQFQVVDGVHVHFDVSPGWVGQNTFYVTLYDDNAVPLNDATLIRVRLDNQTRPIGQSEVRPTLISEDGEYAAEGANLSTSGTWRARVTVARPGEFDVLADFSLTMQPPPVAEGVDMRLPLSGHALAELLTGLALLVLGGFAGVSVKFWRFSPLGLLSTLILVIGLVAIMSGIGHAQ